MHGDIKVDDTIPLRVGLKNDDSLVSDIVEGQRDLQLSEFWPGPLLHGKPDLLVLFAPCSGLDVKYVSVHNKPAILTLHARRRQRVHARSGRFVVGIV